jgi:hypothetical protein
MHRFDSTLRGVGYPFGGEFWKLGHSYYFRLSSQQFAGISCFVADCDSTFGDRDR